MLQIFNHLLKNDSNIETRILILETIVINQLTFNIIKNELLFDTELEIRNKVLSLIQKKIPINFVNCKFVKTRRKFQKNQTFLFLIPVVDDKK